MPYVFIALGLICGFIATLIFQDAAKFEYSAAPGALPVLAALALGGSGIVMAIYDRYFKD